MHSHCPAEYLTQILTRMSIPGWEPRRCLIAQPPWNVSGHVYDLLMCAVTPSVCLQWGGRGWEERECLGRESHLFDVFVVGGWGRGEGSSWCWNQHNVRGSVWGPRSAELSTRAHAYYVWSLGLASQDYTPKDKGPVLTLTPISALVAQFYYGTVFQWSWIIFFLSSFDIFFSGEISHIQEVNKPCSVLLKGSSWWHESWTEPSPISCSPLLLPGAEDIRPRCCMNEGPELFSPVCTLRHRHRQGTLRHPIASISTCRLLPLPPLLSWICVFFLFNQFKWSKLYFPPSSPFLKLPLNTQFTENSVSHKLEEL